MILSWNQTNYSHVPFQSWTMCFRVVMECANNYVLCFLSRLYTCLERMLWTLVSVPQSAVHSGMIKLSFVHFHEFPSFSTEIPASSAPLLLPGPANQGRWSFSIKTVPRGHYTGGDKTVSL